MSSVVRGIQEGSQQTRKEVEAMPYDDREAKSILSGWKGVRCSAEEWLAAVVNLLNDFEKFWKDSGLRAMTATTSGHLVLFDANERQVVIGFETKRAEIWVKRDKDFEKVVPLDFDPFQKVFASREIDQTIGPTPGQPLPHRSPIAVLTEVVLRAFNFVPPPENDPRATRRV
jgi:hypothetical protein